MYNLEQFFIDYGIEYREKNSRGWYPIHCPYCGENKYHSAVRDDNLALVCYKCGVHPWYEYVRIMTGKIWRSLELQYKSELTWRDEYLLGKTERIIPERLELPDNTEPLNLRGKKYLRKRGFDPELLERVYHLKSVDFLGPYCHRIVIPIFFEGRMISWTTRDISGQSSIRYLSCPESKELYPHKDVLYSYDLVDSGHIIVVEGIFDAIRLGKNVVATFGTGFSPEQVLLLGNFDKVTILFDGEDEAQSKAELLGGLLSGLGVEVENIVLKDIKDPGDMTQEEADKFKREILY